MSDTMWHMERCEHCGSLQGGSTDVGGGVLFRPGHGGIAIEVDGEVRVYVTADELWSIAVRAVGPPHAY